MTDTHDQAIPTVQFELGGKVRTLSCSMYVLWKYEEDTGKSAFDLSLGSLSVKDIIAIVFAAVSQEDSEVTKEQVAKWLTSKHLKIVGQLIKKLFELSAPKSEDEEADGAKKANLKP